MKRTTQRWVSRIGWIHNNNKTILYKNTIRNYSVPVPKGGGFSCIGEFKEKKEDGMITYPIKDLEFGPKPENLHKVVYEGLRKKYPDSRVDFLSQYILPPPEILDDWVTNDQKKIKKNPKYVYADDQLKRE